MQKLRMCACSTRFSVGAGVVRGCGPAQRSSPTNSSTVIPAFAIWSRSKPTPTGSCNGIERRKAESGLRITTWLALCLATDQPARSNALIASRAGILGILGTDRDVYFVGLNRHGEWQPIFSANLKAEPNGVFDVLKRLLTGVALAHAAGHGRAFDDKHSVLILVHRDWKLHRLSLPYDSMPEHGLRT